MFLRERIFASDRSMRPVLRISVLLAARDRFNDANDTTHLGVEHMRTMLFPGLLVVGRTMIDSRSNRSRRWR